jgi:phosphoribosylformylglycinamidine synthase I
MTATRALVVAAPGTNRDRDVAAALERAGAVADIVRLAQLAGEPARLREAALLVIAGGFSHADAFGAGRMFALGLSSALGDELSTFVAAGRPVLGICNGFQTLVRTGLLPGALGHNRSGSFQCEWVTLDPVPGRCVWTDGLEPIDCPIAHGEGRYVHPDPDSLAAAGQVALQYRHNPNGSAADIAGVCDASGVVLGLMPHPENHVAVRQHPLWSRGAGRGLALGLFERGVRHARQC